MSEKVIPDGVDFNTARAALAWEIVEKAYFRISAEETEKWSADKFVDEYTRLFRKAYHQLTSSQPIS